MPDGAFCASPRNPPIAFAVSVFEIIYIEGQGGMHSLHLRILFDDRGRPGQRDFFAMLRPLHGEMSPGLWRARRMKIFCLVESGQGGRIPAA